MKPAPTGGNRLGRIRRGGTAILPAVAAITAVAVFVAVALFAGSRSSATPPLPRLGPARDVYDGDFGDPFVLKVVPGRGQGASSGYALFGTDDPPDHIPTAGSSDLTAWQHGPDAIPVLPAWASRDPKDSLTWAPAVLATAQGYLMYVSLQERASHRECIGALQAATAEGPYVDAVGSPLICQRDLGGSIDPSVVRDAGGDIHLIWKSDGNCCGLATSVWEQTLHRDGLGPTGSAHRLLSADSKWQGGIIENPALTPASAGGWWLFYSGNRFDSAAYATGLAYCPTLAGACRDTGPGPFLSGTGTQYSPGGLDFFTDSRGALWASFATWNRPPRNGRFYCCRSLDIAPMLHT